VNTFIFFSGSIEIEENPSKTMHRGDFFGHQSLVFDHELEFSIKATKDSTLLFISAHTYKKLCRNHPKFGVKLLENFMEGCQAKP
jgi:CRP-like cAMP-binding protein